MRTRDSIEDSALQNASDESYMQHMLLEVLLDIRDLLSQEKVSPSDKILNSLKTMREVLDKYESNQD